MMLLLRCFLNYEVSFWILGTAASGGALKHYIPVFRSASSFLNKSSSSQPSAFLLGLKLREFIKVL